MGRPTVKRTAVKNAPGIRRVVRKYETGRKVEKYEARVKVMGKDVSLGQFPTLNDARAAQTAAKSDVQRSSFVRPSAGKATFLSVAEDWLAGSQVVQTKPRTRKSYAALVHGPHLRPLHEVAINRLDYRALDRHVAALTTSGLKTATVRHVVSVMRRVFAHAVRQGLLAANPMEAVEKPKLRTVAPYVLTLPDVQRLVAHLRTVDARWALLVEFAAFTGARAGEIAGLRVRDLNLLARTVRIERTAQLIDGTWQDGPTKTWGTRTVDSLPRGLCAALARHVADRRSDDYVFGTPATEDLPSRPYHHANFSRRVLTPALAAVRLPIGRTKGGVGLHDLRHFYATFCIDAGMSPTEVARRLGHVNATLVLKTYAHAWERHESAWGDAFDAAYEAAPAPNVVPLRATC